MNLKAILFLSFIGAFTLQGIAEAASISTRVRVLESKVAKHDRQMKSAIQSQQSGQAEMQRSLAQMRALEKKMKTMLEEQKTNKKQDDLIDKRYAFP